MRDGKADKRDRAAESGGRSRQQTGTEQNPDTGPFDLYPEVGSVHLSQKQGIQRLDQQNSQEQAGNGEK